MALNFTEELIDIDYDENLGTKVTRLLNHLRSALQSTDTQVVLMAAKAMGKFSIILK